MAGGVIASAPFGAARVFMARPLPEIGNAAPTGRYGALYGAGEGEGKIAFECAGRVGGRRDRSGRPSVARAALANAVNYLLTAAFRFPAALQQFERGCREPQPTT